MNSKKMTKRSRSLSVEVKVVDDENIIIEWNETEYCLVGGKKYQDLFRNTLMECEIIYRDDGNRPIIKVDKIESGETILYKEVDFIRFI